MRACAARPPGACAAASPTHPLQRPPPLNPPLPTPLHSGASFPNYNVREYVRRRAGERFREGARLDATAADAAFTTAAEELAAARRQATVFGMYHRPQRSIMDVLTTEQHLAREAGKAV